MSIIQFFSVKLYQLKNGILNLFIWFPVIWNDKQWDHSYFYKILIKKIELKEKFFQSSKSYKDSSEKNADQLSDIKQALIRLYEEDYLTPEDFMDIEKGTIDYRAWALAEEELIQKDLDFVFESMKKNIRNWWD